MTLAPIALFVYNRPWHTQQTVEALKKNTLAKESELFIYSDGAKNENAKQSVNEVQAYIDQIEGFKSVTVTKQKKNLGLADSIINGVSEIITKHGKIIVLEDDLVTSPYFLRFMNEALEFYQNEKKVWHISGWNYPLNRQGLNDTFLWRTMNCWGWATWADRWKYYEKNVDKVINEFTKEDIKRFNLDGAENFFGQVTANKKNKINTWAIFWYATIFKHSGLCLNPTQTFVENIGHDGSGIHCGESKAFVTELSFNTNIKFGLEKNENGLALEKIRNFYYTQKKPFLTRALNKLARIMIGKNIIK